MCLTSAAGYGSIWGFKRSAILAESHHGYHDLGSLPWTSFHSLNAKQLISYNDNTLVFHLFTLPLLFSFIMDSASSDSSMARERYSPAPSTAPSTGSTEAPIISMPGAYIADKEKSPDETSKLRTLMGILRKSVQPSNQRGARLLKPRG